MSVPRLTRAWSDRRRAWTLTGLVALLVAIYLALWFAYATNGLVAYGRYTQLAPGQVATVRGADFKLLRLVRTPRISNEDRTRTQAAVEGATWVVATVDVTRRYADENLFCEASLLGPGRRLWSAADFTVLRAAPSYCDKKDMSIGRPYRWEPVFQIPTRDIDAIYGLVVVDNTQTGPRMVLRPPA